MAKKRNEVSPQTLPLSITSIKDLANGQAEAVINAAISAAIRDVEDRGEQDEKKRTVVINLDFEKVGDSVAVTVKAQVKIPPYLTLPTVGRIVVTGRETEMMFSATSADDPDQMTIGGDKDE